MSRVSEAIRELQYAMIEDGIEPENGLPLDLFEYCTSLLPFVNVDLLIQNNAGQILLSWREDKHYGTGWQIPGGIIRMMETIDERIQMTAIREIGCRVSYEAEPIAVHENIIREHREGLKNQLERAHNIALLYNCRVPDDYVIDNAGKSETEEGFLRWFDKFPDNLLDCHKPLLRDERFKKWSEPV
ncbi:MAG: NUDIX domain-containing protein [Oribacterium sp.]|nr:NUDIX domain-containing protein [Lachnospiraceae bacterium]MBP3805426.1 NUDIX domain-containing protein [Oribacterium sp.]